MTPQDFMLMIGAREAELYVLRRQVAELQELVKAAQAAVPSAQQGVPDGADPTNR